MNILDKAEKMYKKKGVRNVVTCAAVIVSALLQSFVIQTFIRPAELLSGGFTGIAILVDMAASKFGMSFPTSLGMLVFNLPVAALCSRSISKRFTAFSLLQVCTLWRLRGMRPRAERILLLSMCQIRQDDRYGEKYLSGTACCSAYSGWRLAG